MTQALVERGDLLDSIQQGDRQAEKRLVSQYWNRLKFILERQNIDSQQVLDLCQDTFVVVIQKARNNEINSESSLGAFIRSVGTNLLIESKRKYKRQATFDCDEFDYIPDTHTSPERAYSRQQLTELVLIAIEQFDISRDRDILKWTYVEHLSKSEICTKLNISPAHFDRVIFRAKQRLKEELARKLNIDLKSHTLSDYLLCIFMCLILQSNHSRIENFVASVRGFANPSHYKTINSAHGLSSLPERKANYEV